MATNKEWKFLKEYDPAAERAAWKRLQDQQYREKVKRPQRLDDVCDAFEKVYENRAELIQSK